MKDYSGISLLFVFSIHANGDGTVVQQLHLHVSTEFASADRLSECFRQFAAECLIEGYGVFMRAGTEP